MASVIVSPPAYSAVCDHDVVAYQRYLEEYSRFVGAYCLGPVASCGDDKCPASVLHGALGDGERSVVGRSLLCAPVGELSGGCISGVSYGRRCCFDSACVREGKPVAGVPVEVPGESGVCGVGDSGGECGISARDDAGSRASVLQEGSKRDGCGRDVRDSQVLGKHTLRNRAWRAEKKEKKQRRKQAQAEFVSPTGRKTFFDKVDEGVVAELQKTRAEAFIAYNKRRVAEEEQRASSSSGVLSMLERMDKIAKTAKTLGQNSRGGVVAGWAATVAASVQEEMIKQASSNGSVPTLEEVAVKLAEMEVSPPSSGYSVLDKRRIEYETRKAVLQEQYDDAVYVDPFEKQEDFFSLKEMYADLFPEEDLVAQRVEMERGIA